MLYLILLKFIIFLLFCVWLNKRSSHLALNVQAKTSYALDTKQKIETNNEIESIRQSRALTLSYQKIKKS